MLKALVQLFAEKFLQSKYPDIAYQCGPSTKNQSQNFSGSVEKSYVAPFSGWAVLTLYASANNTWFKMENATRKAVYCINSICNSKAVSIPMQKGDTIKVDLGTNNTSTATLTFVRNESSK